MTDDADRARESVLLRRSVQLPQERPAPQASDAAIRIQVLSELSAAALIAVIRFPRT